MKNILISLFILKSILAFAQNNSKKTTVVIEGGGEIKTEIKFNNSVKIGNQQTTTKNTKSTAGVNNNKPSASVTSTNASNSIQAYGKYDFVQGEKVIAIEDFQQSNIGDFPLRWNTNGSAEVVTLSGQEGKWLQVGPKTTLLPEFIKSLPENFTFEFDLACSQPFSYLTQEFSIGFVSMQKPAIDFAKWSTAKRGENGLIFGLHPAYVTSKTQGGTNYKLIAASKEVMKNSIPQSQFNHVAKPVVHVAIWRQNDRIRLYLNEEKIWDLPKALANTKLNGVVFYSGGVKTENNKYYFSNIRFAVGAPDTRNKLINDGKFTTTGILFDVNSDRIKPSSYGILKEIATTLNENESIRIKIIGHTDTDGDDASNLTLSKKRADAVKSFLNKEFGVETKRMETEGKGESQPVDKTNTTEGKANNRRVEFIKI